MAQFKFKLQVLLKQRKREEQERQRQLAEQAAVLNSLQEQLRSINERMTTATGELRTHLTGQLDMGFLAAHRRFMAAMQRSGNDLAQKLVQAQIKVDEARGHLAEAARRRKAIEKLREKQLERWQADQSRKETALTDEIGSQLGYRNMLEDSLVEGAHADEMEATS